MIFSLIVLAIWLYRPGDEAEVSAQSQNIVWSEPILLSDPQFRSRAGAIVADRAGNVHVMWSQLMEEGTFAQGDTLYYARWDDRAWSLPVDVLVSSQGGAEHPELAITPDNMLHAIWGTGGENSQLMYARAPACCANDPRNWTQPMSLGGPVNLTSALFADERGRLHAAFASLATGNIVYRRSNDGGISWPVQMSIPGGTRFGDEYTAYPRLNVDEQGRVHAVWTVMPWPGRAVLYAHSDDGGDTWAFPQLIDNDSRVDYDEGYGPILIDIETRGDDEIHLLWDGAPTVERNHVWSSDGGKTWSTPTLIFPIHGAGRSGWNDMVVDSAGTLHAFALKGPWHESWSGGGWRGASSVVSNSEDLGVELVRVALSLGNQLHLIWTDVNGVYGDNNEIWYARGAIEEAPAVAAQPMPTVTPIGALDIAEEAESAPVVALPAQTSPAPTDDVLSGLENTASSGPAEPLLYGLAPTLLVIGIVVAIYVWRMKR